MNFALRPLLCLAAMLGLFWAAGAHAVPFGSENHRGPESRNHVRGNDDDHATALPSRSAPFDLIFSHLESLDACDQSFPDCVRNLRSRSGAGPNEIASHPDRDTPPHGWSNHLLAQLRNRPRSRNEPIRIRPGTQPSNPIPEPQAALLFVAGVGIAVARIRR